MPHLERVQLVPRSLEEVFGFFCEPADLEMLTPDFLRFRILSSQPVPMQTGTLIDYRLQWLGVPMRWQSRIDEFDPPRKFVDVQTKGPYLRWHHTHHFYAVAEGTLVVDAVEYELPWGPLGSLAHVLLVRRSLDEIFDYRRKMLGEIFQKGPAE